jgi:RNA polymerase sigma-70 factor, ECF subfamily
MQHLIDRAKTGDSVAMEQLLATVAPSLQRFGMRMCRDDTDAEDVLQDALLTIANHLGEFEGRSSFTSWAFAVARSACSRKRRGLKNQPLLSIENAEEQHEGAPSPEQQVLDRELTRVLNNALDRLPDEYREVILLRDVEALTAPEAADSLGISVPALKSRLHRARTALRDVLKPVLEPQSSAATTGCPDVLALWSSKLEGDLSPTDCAQMEKHLETCTACNTACTALKAALLACQRAGTSEARPELQTAVKSAVQQWIVSVKP